MKVPPSVIALLLQLAAFALAVLALRLLGIQLPPLLFGLLCGTLAATLSRFAGLARWWLFIQFAFAPALVLVSALNIPPIFFLVAFLIMLVVYWSTFHTQVPLYFSSKKVWKALETKLPASQPFTFVDLGSGIGGVLAYLARTHPQGQYLGIETAPLPFLWSLLRIKLCGYRNCTVRRDSFWDSDLSQFDVVFAYLSPVPMDDLWKKVRREMRPDSQFISNTFSVPDHPPQETITVDDLHRSTLYVWHM